MSFAGMDHGGLPGFQTIEFSLAVAEDDPPAMNEIDKAPFGSGPCRSSQWSNGDPPDGESVASEGRSGKECFRRSTGARLLYSALPGIFHCYSQK